MNNKPAINLTRINKIFSKLEFALLIIAGIGLILLLLAICYGVFSREVLKSPLFWTAEFAGYAMVYLVFFSAPWLLKESAHISVDLFTTNLKNKSKKISTLINSIISGAVSALFFWYAMKLTIDLYQSQTVMLSNIPWPKFVLVLPIAIGSFFLFIRFIIIISETILHFNENEVESENV